MSKDNQQKKVFDVMRPGKALASPTSRPVITGHKPQIKDDQFVGGDPHMAGNPFDEKSLMDHPKENKFADAGVSGVSDEEAPKLPDNFPADSGEVAPVSPPDMDKPAEEVPPVAVTDAAPTDSDLQKGHSEDIALVPDEPQAPAPDTTKSERFNLTPEDITKEPEQESTPEPEPAPAPGSGPSVISPSGGVQTAMTHDDVMAATGAPVLDRAIVSHHKVKSKWWEWVLIFLLILLLALAALNFLIDAEIIKLNAAIPHTDLID